jgi:hypothetical protein
MNDIKMKDVIRFLKNYGMKRVVNLMGNETDTYTSFYFSNGRYAILVNRSLNSPSFNEGFITASVFNYTTMKFVRGIKSKGSGREILIDIFKFLIEDKFKNKT